MKLLAHCVTASNLGRGDSGSCGFNRHMELRHHAQPEPGHTTPIAVMELASLRLAQAISTTNSREASAAPARPASVWPAATATTRSTRPLHHSQPQQPVSKSVTGVSLMGSIQRSETGQVCDAFDSCVTFGSGSDSNSVSIFGLFTDIKNHHSGFLTISSGTGEVLTNQLQVTPSGVPEPNA